MSTRKATKHFSLRNIVASLLREANEEEMEPGEDSLDAQIDKYFSTYESEAKNIKTEALDFRAITRRLLEAEDDEEAGGEELDFGDDEEGGDEEGGDEEGGDEEAETEDEGGEEASDEEGGEEADSEEKEPEKLTAEDIDIRSFVSDVMRLIENYDSLLEVRNTILRRASNYIAKNYEEDVVEMFNNDLLDSYGVEIGKSKFEMEDDYLAPRAGAAGPMGGGA